MKIIFNIKSLHTPAGTERATVAIANMLSNRGYNIQIIQLEKAGEPFYAVHPAVKLHYLFDTKDNRPGLVRDFSRRKKLKEIYRLENPDVIVFVGSARSMLYIPSAKGYKTVTWEHFNAGVNWHLMHPLSKLLAAKFCDRIVTLTNDDILNYKKKFGAENAVCIPNPVTIEDVQISPLTEKRVLAVGRLTYQKGFDLLLDSWRKTKGRNDGWTLCIVGSGKMGQLLTEKIEKYALRDSVEIIPPASNILKHYLTSSLFVMSSRYEGLPLVMIEAMACGLPVVSFDCPTGPRDIIKDNETGILVPPMDVEKLAVGLDNMMADKGRRMLFSKNAVQRAELFSPDIIADRWEELFQKIELNMNENTK